MSTPAERQRERRRRLRANGIRVLQIEANPEAIAFLDACLDQCGATKATWGATLLQWLLRGAAFSANSGAALPKQCVPAGALHCNTRQNHQKEPS